MNDYFSRFLLAMRPAFSRQAAFNWFVIAVVGILLRNDTLGVSSIVRALSLAPHTYPCLLHFFHSNAWTVERLMGCWWKWQSQEPFACRIGGRIALMGDHTKAPKDGRKMPAVTTLHQDSETSSKPGFFRGHHWGCVSQLMSDQKKTWSSPLLTHIHQGLEQVEGVNPQANPMTIQIIRMAQRIAREIDEKAYLVLDAFFATGTVFLEAAREFDGESQRIHILTRTKKNGVAYIPYVGPQKSAGRHRIYGEKLKLVKLFDSPLWQKQFQEMAATVYQKKETVRFLSLDLLWKPAKGLIRFFLFETSRGRIILMTSDLTLEPQSALFLYCERTTIETLFNTLKNVMGGFGYHFWSQPLPPVPRRPSRKGSPLPKSTRPLLTRNTFWASEKFVNSQLLVTGFLQLLAARFPLQIWAESKCWLRTYTSETPSVFVTRTALATIIRRNLFGFGFHWITQLIKKKQENSRNPANFKKIG